MFYKKRYALLIHTGIILRASEFDFSRNYAVSLSFFWRCNLFCFLCWEDPCRNCSLVYHAIFHNHLFICPKVVKASDQGIFWCLISSVEWLQLQTKAFRTAFASQKSQNRSKPGLKWSEKVDQFQKKIDKSRWR